MKNRDVRATLAKAIEKVGDASNLPMLEDLKRRADSEIEAEDFALAMRAIQVRAT